MENTFKQFNVNGMIITATDSFSAFQQFCMIYFSEHCKEPISIKEVA